MPLSKGSSRKTIQHNIHEMVEAGHPVKQAVAAALHNAHYKRKTKDHVGDKFRKGVYRMGAHGPEQ